jgi:hypothetical protein
LFLKILSKFLFIELYEKLPLMTGWLPLTGGSSGGKSSHGLSSYMALKLRKRVALGSEIKQITMVMVGRVTH